MIWWSIVLAAIGITGLYIAGKKNYWGWAIGIFAQTLWIAYALSTKQYGFLATAVAYAWVYSKNFIQWRKIERVNAQSERTA